MESQPFSPEPSSAPAPKGNESVFAAVSLMTGITSLCASLLPRCGGPLAIASIIFGYLAMKNPEKKTLAIAGMALGGVGLFLTCLSAAYGAYVGMTGQGFQFSP